VTSGSGRELVFAGASSVGRGTPWGTLCEITARTMERAGYSVRIETRSWGPHNGRYVADGRANLGAWSMMWLRDCYHGLREYADEGPRGNLRVIANINAPAWAAIAVNEASGITDLGQVAAERRPARVYIGAGPLYQEIVRHYGWTPELLESWGGFIRSVHEGSRYDAATAPIDEPEFRPWARSGEFDVIIDSLYVGYLPENHHWVEASILWNLRFLPVPGEVTERVVESGLGRPGWVPHRILRGAWTDVPAIARLPDVIYCSADAPDELAYQVAAGLDADRAAFRQCHLPFSYDPGNVAEDFGVPLHPGAQAYYRSAGYPMGKADRVASG
jgi:TRAP-type uncharacterized transport system substrate-binding protein